MKQPRLLDDGTTVQIDLHGFHVDEAIDLVRRVASIASERGRSTLRIIHGSSTSDPLTMNRTIKHVLLDAMDGGIHGVTSHYSMEDVTLLNLDHSRNRDPRPLALNDLR